MGGLAAGLACARAGWEVRLFEQAGKLSEVGAGIQLGPNATRILRSWGLESAVAKVAAVPVRLRIRSALDGEELGSLRLESLRDRYGAPYLTIHRADLQSLLRDAAEVVGVHVKLNSRASAVRASASSVELTLNAEQVEEGDALVVADGLWSALRAQVFADGRPRATGHVAYRALAAQQRLPAVLRSADVTVWLGPRLHVVSYPVRAGEQLNVVGIVEGGAAGAAEDWDQAAPAGGLALATGPLCQPLRDLISAMPAWKLWVLHDRPPVRSAAEMARGRVALLGDAAHPMRPYLAQGAGMAIEDAAELGRSLAAVDESGAGVEAALQRYAVNRWERCAQVQARAERNGRIFHATGLVRWGRDWSMRLLGEQLLDQPWLYR